LLNYRDALLLFMLLLSLLLPPPLFVVPDLPVTVCGSCFAPWTLHAHFL